MINPVQKAAADWEAAAIEQARNDPRVAELGLCPECLCQPPCLCDCERTVRKMRAVVDQHMTLKMGRLTIIREPELIGSWGVSRDGLMEELFRVATKSHEDEVRRLRAENRKLKGEPGSIEEELKRP